MAKTKMFLVVICLFIIDVPKQIHAKMYKLYDFDKAQLLQHNKKVCITIKGDQQCVKADESPGDPTLIGKIFSLYAVNSGSDDDGGDLHIPDDDENINVPEYADDGEGIPIPDDGFDDDDIHIPDVDDAGEDLGSAMDDVSIIDVNKDNRDGNDKYRKKLKFKPIGF